MSTPSARAYTFATGRPSRGRFHAIATLLAIRGPLMGMRLDLADETRIGRAESNDLVLAEPLASREHAVVRRRGLAWMVEDLGSRHGTFVNRQKLAAPRPLLRNDMLQIGESQFLFDAEIDVENADYSRKAVFLSAPHDETVESPAVGVLPAAETTPQDGERRSGDSGFEFLATLGRLFDSSQVSFPDALRHMCERLQGVFAADLALLMMWESASNRLRPSVALAEDEEVLADSSVIARVFRDRKALMLSDLGAAPAKGTRPRKRTVIAAPLVVDDERVLGVLYLEKFESDAYSLVDLRHLQAAARLAAVFVEIRQRAEALELRARLATADSGIVGRSAKLKEALQVAAKIAPTKSTVMLLGETGVGKEMFAREIHRQSEAGKAGGPFVAVNCTAVPETLFESLLFGHERGAFTGADKTQRGYIEQAAGGTLFLDEIGELSLAMQPKLLRFLQERVFTRVGGQRLIRGEVRLVCATNRDLEAEVAAGQFREDLYHRLSVFPVEIPPLRDRPEDVAPLAEAFIRRHATELGKEILGIAPEALVMLEKYPWPGNVRELSNCVERAVLLADEKVLMPRDFHLGWRRSRHAPQDVETRELVDTSNTGRVQTLEQVEKRHITEVLERMGGNQVQAARALGIHRNTLRNKIRQYGLE